MNRGTIGLIISFLVLTGVALWLNNNHTYQDFIGSCLSGLNENRREQLIENLSKKSDKQLIKLLSNGDGSKQGIASELLAQRNNPDLFEEYVKLLNSPWKDTRGLARGLLFVDRERAISILLTDFKKYSLGDDDFSSMVRLFSKYKVAESFNLLFDIARNAPRPRKDLFASAFESLGNPAALPYLYEVLNEIPDDYYFAKDAKKSVQKAIVTLESIKKQQEAG